MAFGVVIGICIGFMFGVAWANRHPESEVYHRGRP
jgi:hypothetical protein